MKSNAHMYDVAIIGAGPVGLSMANFLGENDLRILVIEKEETTSSHSRAPAIWPPTLEIFESFGLIDEFKKAGIKMPQMDICDADRDKIILTAPIKELKTETSHPYLLIVPQSKTEKILLKGASRFENITLCFGTELIGLQQQNELVNLKCSNSGKVKEFKAKMVVGADGAHSFVRESIGAKLQGHTYPMEAALADIELTLNPHYQSPRITTQTTLAMAIKIDQKLWRLILPLSKETAQKLEDRIEEAASQLFNNPEYTVVWKDTFNLHNRISSVFSKNRVVLIGDAAHLNSPVGGQGMNAGIQDVPMIGEAILHSLQHNEFEMLQKIAAKRRKSIKNTVNKFTDRITRYILLKGKGRLIKPIFFILNSLMNIKPFRKGVLKRMAMIH